MPYLQIDLNPRMFIPALKGIIPGEISVEDFSAVTKFNEIDSHKILTEFSKNGIGIKLNDKFEFTSSDKLKAGLFLLQQGFPIDEIAESIDWRNFEGLVKEILQEKNFATIQNLILTKPRMEIDVIGIRLGVAMLIDCKHWKYSSHSALKTAAQKQIDRTKHYVSKTEGAIAIPVIVTLYADKVDFINKVPIVPIFQFSSFIDEFYGNLDQMNSIEKD
ncbi:MAG: hypothetical protein R3327_01950 [Nitrosopumilaceae archaeon]|nr:hypothetical protein [Nitrosopumilaceae archaeon]